MVWHFITEIARWIMLAYGLCVFIGLARSGQLRRIWNWPMRISVVCRLFFALLCWLNDLAAHRHLFGNYVRAVLMDTGLLAFTIGLVSLGVFLIGFLLTLLRDLRSPVAELKLEMKNQG